MISEKPEKTQREVARAVGIREPNLSDLFNGHRVAGLSTARKIAAYLGRADWWSFVEMPGEQLRRELMEKGGDSA